MTLSAECSIPIVSRLPEESPPYFELFGFDVMVDSNMRPWLLEVNSPPQLHIDTEVDRMIKPYLCKDMILMVFHNRTENNKEYIDDYDNDIISKLSINRESRQPPATYNGSKK